MDTETPRIPVTNPTPGIPGNVMNEIEDKWSASVAGKRFAWGVASWEASIPAGIALAPTASAFIEKISAFTTRFGVELHINRPVFENMLPVLIFGSLLIAHDFAKFKYGDANELTKKIL